MGHGGPGSRLLKGYEDGPTVECDALIWASAKSMHEPGKPGC